MAAITDKEYYHLNASITKALNPLETPLKLKHARTAIITTHRSKEAKTFWSVILRQPLMEHRFTAWKFCHLLHKILREGHPNSIKHSQTHKKMVLEMGKLWGHLNDGVGHCIQAYSKLLVTKLEFHDKNPIFPGSLTNDFRDIENYAGDDINVYFQMGVEIFDYLDDIIEVQQKVFASVNTYRMSSMTPQGQCRLAPLITLIQDSNPLYDLCVRIMFKLHDHLPNDTLSGHRTRFREMFLKLKLFYDNARPLQYFADLIQVPFLPDNTPNFTSKVDFGSYQPPVVVVPPEPEPEPELVMDDLVDVSSVVSYEDNSNMMQPVQTTPSAQDEIIYLQNTLREKEITVHQMENDLTNVRVAYVQMEQQHNRDINELRNEISSLSKELMDAKEACVQMRNQKDELELKLSETPVLKQKASETEEKARASEEKFNKLKSMYTEIRDEHINLLRQHGESTKLLNKQKQINEELLGEKEELEKQLITLKDEEAKVKEITQSENQQLEQKLRENSVKYEDLLLVHEKLKSDYQKLAVDQSAELGEMVKKSQTLEETVHQLKGKVDELTSQNTELQTQLRLQETNLQESNSNLQRKADEFTRAIEAHNLEIKTKTDEFETLKQQQSIELAAKIEAVRVIESQLANISEEKKKVEVDYQKLNEANAALQKHLQESSGQLAKLEDDYKKAVADAVTAVSEKRDFEQTHNKFKQNLLESIVKTVDETIHSNFHETGLQATERIFQILARIKNVSKDLISGYGFYIENREENIPYFAKVLVLFCYNVTMLREQCLLISNTTTDIEKGEAIFSQMNSLQEPVHNLLQLIESSSEPTKVSTAMAAIELELSKLNGLVETLVKSLVTNMEVGDLIEKELSEMDKTIAEAAEKFVELLQQARSKDNGVKLEVNERILDSCTTLMEAIKVLIKRSKILQDDIVSTGRGTASVKEFYKRNSQWTEGLISASKSVAKAANLLVEAANKSVSSDESTQNFEIIVAAQEIAACTAQLVIASKVKVKSPSNTKLQDLTKASKDVSKATGGVVAVVKDCNQQLEQANEIDLTKLTPSQVKTMEMEIQVKVLELEQALQMERLKLTSFRRSHYQSADD